MIVHTCVCTRAYVRCAGGGGGSSFLISGVQDSSWAHTSPGAGGTLSWISFPPMYKPRLVPGWVLDVVSYVGLPSFKPWL